jgi:hypothetical protein
MKNKKAFLLPFFILHLFFAKAQTEFIVTVDPATGTHAIINSLPGIHYIAMNATALDKNNHRYMLSGIDFSSNYHLYTIDALTGTILSQPAFPFNAGEFHYDNSSNKLFGLYINNSVGKMFVASFDLSTGIPTVADTLPIVGYAAGSTAYDETDHLFFMIQSGSLYASNVLTGITTVTPAAGAYGSLQYDNASAGLYGLTGSSSKQLVKINPATGAYTAIGSPVTISSGLSSVLITFDEINHIYTFGDPNNLYSLNAVTGALISNPAFPQVPTGENIIELHYDNSNGILYGLHWGTNDVPEGIATIAGDQHFKIYPNPLNESATIAFDNPENKKYSFTLYNTLGQQQLEIGDITSGITINRANLAKGLYFFTLRTTNNQIAFAGKLQIN